MVEAVDERTALVDVLHTGRRSLIGVGVLEFDDGLALVDPGPEARLETLWAALAGMGCGPTDVRAVLLTHIHLDHAAATGAIVQAAPRARVFVHPVGAPHMLDPSRLLGHARRIYGDQMKRLWGDVLPVPERALRQVGEGSEVKLGARRLLVADVPGHAKHHVAYFEPETGVAWVGDAGGLRIEDGPPVPVTPPPDIDVDAWNHSIDRIMAWRPKRIATTHFGVHEDPEAHFDQLRQGLSDWAVRVRRSLEDGAERQRPTDAGAQGDHERARAFARHVRAELASAVSPDVVELYAAASAFEDSWRGLARYWRKVGLTPRSPASPARGTGRRGSGPRASA